MTEIQRARERLESYVKALPEGAQKWEIVLPYLRRLEDEIVIATRAQVPWDPF